MTEIRYHSGSKYLREIIPCELVHLGNPATGTPALFRVDVYAVLDAYRVTCPAIQHAIKKLLCAGLRDKADTKTDLTEARDAIYRAIELAAAREALALTEK